MHAASDEPVARRLQISGHTLFTNELEMLRVCWKRGAAGDFADASSCGAVEGCKKAAPPEVWAAGDSSDDGDHLETVATSAGLSTKRCRCYRREGLSAVEQPLHC